jgi:general secretion pathway protein K
MPEKDNIIDGFKKIGNHNGIALFIVLWALVLLSVIAGEFAFSMRSEVKMARNDVDENKAYFYARAGINIAIYEIMKLEKDSGTLSNKKEIKPDTAAATKETKKDTVTKVVTKKELKKDPITATGKNKLTGENYEDEDGIQWRLNGETEPIPFDEGFIKVKIENESGKVNINKAEPPLLRILFSTFNLKEEQIDIIVDSIVDWRDSDQLHGLNGAEDDYYEGLGEPYACKDADFDSIEELILVRGVTPQIYNGGLKEMVTVAKEDTKKPVSRSPIQQYLNLENRPKNSIQELLTIEKRTLMQSENEFDYQVIDLNSAPPELLLSLPGMDEDSVLDVLEYRKLTDFRSPAELIKIIGINNYVKASPYIAVQRSKLYTISATGLFENYRISHTVTAKVLIDKDIPSGYKIIDWWDCVFDFPLDFLTDETRNG